MVFAPPKNNRYCAKEKMFHTFVDFGVKYFSSNLIKTEHNLRHPNWRHGLPQKYHQIGRKKGYPRILTSRKLERIITFVV